VPNRTLTTKTLNKFSLQRHKDTEKTNQLTPDRRSGEWEAPHTFRTRHSEFFFSAGQLARLCSGRSASGLTERGRKALRPTRLVCITPSGFWTASHSTTAPPHESAKRTSEGASGGDSLP
jgi:hypothetical protein